MAAKEVMVEEVSKDIFVVKQHSSLVKMIEFGYILHSFMVDSELVKENEWFEFAFGINLKILETNDEFVILNSSELSKVLNWLDWICQIIVNSDGEHNNSSFIKSFLSKSDLLFKKFKHINEEAKVIVEKLK